MKNFILGTSIKITSVLNITIATTAVITVEDPSGGDKVTATSMTKEADNVYYYILQTAESWDSGIYVVTVKITFGGYDSIKEIRFEAIDPFDNTD